jgi:hypothetical protein
MRARAMVRLEAGLGAGCGSGMGAGVTRGCLFLTTHHSVGYRGNQTQHHQNRNADDYWVLDIFIIYVYNKCKDQFKLL